MLRNIALAAALVASGIAAAHAASPFPMSPNESGPYVADAYLAPGTVVKSIVANSATFPMSVSESGPNAPDAYATTAEPQTAPPASVQSKRYGDAADGAPARTVQVSGSARYINVRHMEAVRLVDQKGHSFVWAFDTLGETQFPLRAIAPAGFETANAVVYVTHPASHVSSD